MVDTRGLDQPPSSDRTARALLIVALVGLLVPVVGVAYGDNLLCRLGHHNRLCPTPPIDPPTTEPTRTPTPTWQDPPSTQPQPQPPSQSAAVRWTGQFLLRKLNGVELDTLPPSPATGPAGNLEAGDLFYDDSEALGYWLTAFNRPVAVWQSDEEPNPRACADAITTVGYGKVRAEPGVVLCVATTGRRIAALQVVEEKAGGVLLNVTVWG